MLLFDLTRLDHEVADLVTAQQAKDDNAASVPRPSR